MPPTRWLSPAEIRKATRLQLAGHSANQIAEVLGRSQPTISKLFKHLGIAARERPVGRPWTKEENAEFQRLVALDLPYKEIGQKLNRSHLSIIARAHYFGIRKTRAWTNKQIKKIEELRADGRTWEYIAEELDRDVGACRAAWKKYGVIRNATKGTD